METSSDLLGRVFTRLRVIAYGEAPRRWVCQCVCGKQTIVPAYRLLSGNTKSCGCLKRSVLGDATRTHGRANSRLTGYADRAYGVWQAMRDRCNNPNRADYHRYGGRGITVCKRWESFENFLEDMGNPPKGYTLDRISNDKGYSPKNCKWSTRKEQVYNSSKVRLVTIGGKTKTLGEWLSQYAVTRSTFYQRLRRGYTEQEAITNNRRTT